MNEATNQMINLITTENSIMDNQVTFVLDGEDVHTMPLALKSKYVSLVSALNQGIVDRVVLVEGRSNIPSIGMSYVDGVFVDGTNGETFYEEEYPFKNLNTVVGINSENVVVGLFCLSIPTRLDTDPLDNNEVLLAILMEKPSIELTTLASTTNHVGYVVHADRRYFDEGFSGDVYVW